MYEPRSVFRSGVRLVRPLQVALVLSAVVIGFTAVPIDQREVYACSCWQPKSDADFREIIDAYDLVLVGSIAAHNPESAYPDKVHIAVEKVYKGPALRDVALEQSVDLATDLRNRQSDLVEQQIEVLGPDCSYVLLGYPGESYLLFLNSQPDGTFEPGGCSSHAFRSGRVEPYLEPLERLTGGGVPLPTHADEDQLPVWLVPSLAAASLVGLVFAGGLLHRLRRRRHSA